MNINLTLKSMHELREFSTPDQTGEGSRVLMNYIELVALII